MPVERSGAQLHPVEDVGDAEAGRLPSSCTMASEAFYYRGPDLRVQFRPWGRPLRAASMGPPVPSAEGEWV